MLSRWPIRRKLTVGASLLLITVGILAFSGYRAVYAYRGLARTISRRAAELPAASQLAQSVNALQATLKPSHQFGILHDNHTDGSANFNSSINHPKIQDHLLQISLNLDEYRSHLDDRGLEDRHIGNINEELEAVEKIQKSIDHMHTIIDDFSWLAHHSVSVDQLQESVDELQAYSAELPLFLQRNMQSFREEVRGKYRTWIALWWVTSILAVVLLSVSMRMFYAWFFQPLRVLIHGSRIVAAGKFSHRIALDTKDEMAELAAAMNKMTSRFQQIRDDLDHQVKQRTKQVVRGEQLASVGFLAAGVAHEINNPLASIALCAESLEERVRGIIAEDDSLPDDQHSAEVGVLRDYLRMIQDEAFRCKEITEKLLDFSRLGDVEKHNSDLTELIRGVIDMVGHIGKYQNKTVVFTKSDPVVLPINSQEIKQVVLNLITNALDSLAPDGRVDVSLTKRGRKARIIVSDNGCGMTDEVKDNLFEPFFTRRRDGQGTGLGMSISYRIITDHGGQIDAESPGPGKGSTLTVTLPVMAKDETQHVRKAA